MQNTGKAASEKDIDRLVTKATGGNAGAFGELYDIYVAQIYRYIYYRVGSTVDAEDLAQQVFVRAWDAIGKYRKKSTPFIAWLMTISRNLVIDFYRARKDNVSLDGDYEFASHDAGPVELAEKESERREITRSINKLSEEQRQIVLMRFIESYSYEEIASVLKKNESTVRVILHRALKKLRIIMEQDRKAI